VTGPRRVEDLLRASTPQVVGTLTRRYGQFDTCEDATQEALLKGRWCCVDRMGCLESGP
jgi:predicted RNA polymerase sigma factor